ncbi:ROK family protein [Jiangella aurantiaca]|uniref:ROK family protein n=2 Tax=Jiangella aurantiaca TaxID=2530373 RepID=A0A4V2YR47_9ACTN|nr:ROK family protein [Jiangella aurantiaca]
MAARYAHSTTPGGIYALVRDGLARSRADLARLTGLAPSTITLRVEELLRRGYLDEEGDGVSRGGRRPRVLRLARDERVVAGVDLGARHAAIGLFDVAGTCIVTRRSSIDITRPPEVVLRSVHREILDALAASNDAARRLAGVGLSLPGPVSAPEGRVISPSRMPGWNGIDPAAILSGLSGVPVRTENDANAMALGEFIATGRTTRHMIVVKAGSSIGTGVIVDGALYRGARGMAGDVSHTSVADGPQVLCSCGRFGCLDAVAGGRSIVAALAAAGVPIDDVAGVAGLASDAHPLATRLLRESGLRTGAVLATLVSFFNPERLVLAGVLSTTEAFVAGVRSSVYDLCLPMSTTGLELAESTVGWDLGARGVAALALEELLDPAAVDRDLGKSPRT